jgi:hypothetical protein
MVVGPCEVADEPSIDWLRDFLAKYRTLQGFDEKRTGWFETFHAWNVGLKPATRKTHKAMANWQVEGHLRDM